MWYAYTSSTPSEPSLFVLVYKSKRLIVAQPTCYDTCHASIRQHFPEIPMNHKITFHTKDLDVCDGQFAQISKESWGVIIPLLKSITIQTEAPRIMHDLDGRAGGSGSNKIQLTLRYGNSSSTISVTPKTNMTELYAAAQGRFNLDIVELFKNRQLLSTVGTVGTLGMENGDVIECSLPFLAGRKPVIYLYSPSELVASVTLSLVRQWKISAVYPVVPIKRLESRLHEELEWKVRIRSNGELTEINTGLDVAYLFWEAQTNSLVPVSPPQSPIMGCSPLGMEVFNPNDARLFDNNSVVLSVDTITPYLDAVLKELSLQTEARTSFITYWLPDMLKHKHVALRFLPQSAYERAAPLKITPAPDITTRVFMLFRGIDEEVLSDWPQARERAGYAVDFWKDIVGVDCERSLDESLFRVLEWGGMEVKS